MSRAEEIKVARKVKAGDIKAKEKLILANLRFVVQVAKQYMNANLQFIDLINEGNIGLIRAVETFDVDKGSSFISYAVHWIKQSIIKAISEKWKIVRIPLNANLKLIQINNELQNTKMEDLTEDFWNNLAQKLKLKRHTLTQLLSVKKNHLSFDKTLKGKNDSVGTLKDYLADSRNNNAEAELFEKDLKRQLAKLLKKLSPLEREIIHLRYNLENQNQVETLESIGKKKGYTKERIRQIEKSALARLRSTSLEKGKWGSLKDYLENVTHNFQNEMLQPSF